MSKLRDIIYTMFVTDDANKHKVSYDLGKTVNKGIKKILKLKIKDLNDE
ncbi:hypothetical protein LCGC14_1837190 [marine sediment metagenome]|uniref:Uncharacterized protein n=1 Tax=marine sediment metagenome TaxID=412755 RepID=A0A0F9JDR2_9ZZZZ